MIQVMVSGRAVVSGLRQEGRGWRRRRRREPHQKQESRWSAKAVPISRPSIDQTGASTRSTSSSIRSSTRFSRATARPHHGRSRPRQDKQGREAGERGRGEGQDQTRQMSSVCPLPPAPRSSLAIRSSRIDLSDFVRETALESPTSNTRKTYCSKLVGAGRERNVHKRKGRSECLTHKC
eukprot:SAG22_NODE_301_length_12744_cov_19.648189_16_plen_179_part_00